MAPVSLVRLWLWKTAEWQELRGGPLLTKIQDGEEVGGCARHAVARGQTVFQAAKGMVRRVIKRLHALAIGIETVGKMPPRANLMVRDRQPGLQIGNMPIRTYAHASDG
jgi:hypothetical protein